MPQNHTIEATKLSFISKGHGNEGDNGLRALVSQPSGRCFIYLLFFLCVYECGVHMCVCVCVSILIPACVYRGQKRVVFLYQSLHALPSFFKACSLTKSRSHYFD